MSSESPEIRANGQSASSGPMNRETSATGISTGRSRVSDSIQERLKSQYLAARTAIQAAVLGENPPSSEADIYSALATSRLLLGDYATLDWEHRQEIVALMQKIQDYGLDPTRKRPLNILMHAEPGSGKSHFVKCLAAKLSRTRASAVDFNMAALQTADDLIHPLDCVRNLKVADRLPVLFLDEFDSDKRWFPALLPLLWDGELHVGHRDLKLGKLVVLLAGSSRGVGAAVDPMSNSQPQYAPDTKLVDLLSRINGGAMGIPSLDLHDENFHRDRRVDKVCMAISLLQRRFDHQVDRVPWALLGLIGKCRFKYSARSIAHMIDLLPALPANTGDISLDAVRRSLPLNQREQFEESSLAYHMVDTPGTTSVVRMWEHLRELDLLVRVSPRVRNDAFG